MRHMEYQIDLDGRPCQHLIGWDGQPIKRTPSSHPYANSGDSKLKPLSIEELRSVCGEPVFIDPHGWRICYGIDAAELHGGVEKVNFGNGCYLPISGYGTLWLPYCQKPKREECTVPVVGACRRWPAELEDEKPFSAHAPTDITPSTVALKTVDLKGEEMSLLEAVEVLENGDWSKLLPDNTKSREIYDVICELFDAHEVAVEAMRYQMGQWISVSERLPTELDADDAHCVLAIHVSSTCNKRYFHWRTVADNPFDFSHWMKVPSDP